MKPARPGLRVGVIGEGMCSRRVAALGGVMEAASRGAARAGGLVVGLLPGFEARDANRWVRVPIVAGMDQAEIALALKLGRPVVGLGTWRLAQPEGRRGWLV